MARISLIPNRLDRNTSEHELELGAASVLQRVSLSRQVGRVIRGFGMIPSQHTPTTSTFFGETFRTPEGNYAVIGSANGSIQVTRPDTLLGTGPAGILPLFPDRSQAGGRGGGGDDCDERGCCGGHCVDCNCAPAGFDIDLTLNTAPVCSGAVQNIAGNKTVKPCIKACPDCNDKTDGGAKVSFRVVNNTGKCIRVQFLFTVGGLPANCRVRGRYGCEAGGAAYNNGAQVWFYVCVGVGGTVTGCMDHVIRTLNGGCCDAQSAECCDPAVAVTLSAFQYQLFCHDGTGCIDAFCNDGVFGGGCPSC